MTRSVRINPDDKRQNPDEHMYEAPRAGGLIASRVGDGSSGTSKVFPEDHEPWRKRILDPGSNLVMRWNKVFLTASLVALFIDPLYLYLLSARVDPINSSSCIKMDRKFRIQITVLRTITDLFYVLLIAIKFRTAYVAPSSRVFGRGELVTDPRKIAWRYLKSDFFIDLAAALPFPQIVFWVIMPAITNSSNVNGYNTLALIILFQYIPRSYLISPLSYQIIKATRFVTKTAWTGAAYNLLLYMIASHVVGATFYLLTVERQVTCWKQQCVTENGSMNTPLCDPMYLDCDFPTLMDQQSWANSTSVFTNCDPINSSIPFNFGIFTNSLATDALSSAFSKQFFFCLWWGLQNLCTYGQGLTPSTYIGETAFASVVSVLGLLLFAQLIGNMETYLESITVKLEEWRLKRKDTEEWMKHRQLPPDLRERVRRFVQYKWFATRGVDEESVLRALPADLRRDIQNHLCLNLVRRVPLFSQMDDQLLDAICECLVSSLSTEGTFIVREGDPVIEMLFIIRGRLESSTTNGGRTGFFNSIILRPGDFCGEELLSWALLPNSTANLPHSTRTVKALVEVEAFALRAEDLKFVANQFRRLHSKKLQHTFRFYSHHWRTWAACFIQARWRRFKRRKKAKDLCMWASFNSLTDEQEADESWHQEEGGSLDSVGPSHHQQNLGVTMQALKFAASTRKEAQKMKLQKPDDPDFSADGYD